jgi:small subunit ribosomal protein S1
LTEEQQGGTQPPAEASAEAQAADQTVGGVAIADEPATSPSLDAEATDTTDATEASSDGATATTDQPATEAPASAEAAEEPLTVEAAIEEPGTEPATAEPVTAEAETAESATADAVTPEAESPAEAAAAALTSPEAAADPVIAPEVDTLAPDTGTPASAADTEAPAADTNAAEEQPAVAAEAPPEMDAAADAATSEPEAAPKPAPVPSGPEPTTMEELLAEQDTEIKSFKHGDVVEGSVVRIDKDEILVDIGAKSEGVVSNRELFGRNTEAQPALNIGDTVLVYVLQPESPEGHVVLSLRRAGLERKWRSMQEQFEAGVIIEAPVIDHNKGGLIVDCGIRGFVPISQIVDFPRRPQNDQPRDAAQEIAEKLQPFVGRKLRLKILEVNRKANRLILSEKVALYEERREKRDELFSSLQVGQRVKGHVRSIAPFGVFVDLGGIDGLVHKSELSWNKVNNPEGGYRVGEEVEAEVIDINHERGRISLSIRRLQPDPWHSTVADFNVGDIIDGTVTKLVNFGAFVRVRDGLEGLIHISELSNQRVAHPGDVVHEGQQLKLRIISLDSERHRLGLSLKQAEEAPARPAPEPMTPAPSRPERGERPERGDRRQRGDRERPRSYTAADAIQEPEGGIDTTLAAAFAGVREQLARAEAEDDVEPTAGEAEADFEASTAAEATTTEPVEAAGAADAEAPEEAADTSAADVDAATADASEPAPAPEAAEATEAPEATEAGEATEEASVSEETVDAPLPRSKSASKPAPQETAADIQAGAAEVATPDATPADEAGLTAEPAEPDPTTEPAAAAEAKLASEEADEAAEPADPAAEPVDAAVEEAGVASEEDKPTT